MESSKNQKYCIRDIICNIYEENIFHKNKESKFIYIMDTSFINYTARFGHFVNIIDDAVNPYHISSLNKQLDKSDIKNICHGIY